VPQVQAAADSPLSDAVEAPHSRIQLRANLSALSSAPVHQTTVQLGSVERPHLALLKQWFIPTIVPAMLLICVVLWHEPSAPKYWALGVAVLLISRLIFSPLQLHLTNSPRPSKTALPRLLLEWGAVASLLLFFGFALKLDGMFPQELILSWLALTPMALVAASYWSRHAAARSGTAGQRHIIIGANQVGIELARRVSQSLGSGTFMGYFDFRSLERLPKHALGQFLGQCKDVAAFVRLHAVNTIYIALPMSNAPRIDAMLQEFRDTTASIYFVPDIFAFDLVQARCIELHGIPMLSICDTPFHGMNALKKRGMDILLSSIALTLGWPLMLAIAIGVKLSSPGPILFKQRRYGQYGEEILVYKFRSMTVCEDGPVVVQAKKQDERITAIGRFLRRTSLDELPQLVNVFRGKMSFVGPRPHAVARNELYRKLISGYMIRHKVRPGITGWAQVHGLRGETRTVEQMRLRVQYDLDYLRDWSLWLDFKILLKTALVMCRYGNTY
jgi:putative colanic acid biosynthesis UDP-glucose lipid carrier transferase